MNDDQLVREARAQGEPIQDLTGATAYRLAAQLGDGLLLPCVLVASRAAWLELALRRFAETQPKRTLWRSSGDPGPQYRQVVESFVTSRTSVESYHIASVERSPFAIPAARLAEVRGETRMSWTQFVAVMSDGASFSFGTHYMMEFFAMPSGYAATDIATIRSHERIEGKVIYRERPFFTCFVNGL